MQIPLPSLVAVLGLVSIVDAHGYISNVISGGKSYSQIGPQWIYYAAGSVPATAGWLAYNQDNGFVTPDAYNSTNITCHKGATPGSSSVPVAAGSKLQLQWNTWPDTHHGPVLDYLAHVSGAFSTATAAGLTFSKLDAGGLVSDTTPPGTWATDQLIAANFTWSVTIPSTLAAGNYVLRHEIIALHSAGTVGGAQNYPQCINIQVTGSGTTALPTGVAATTFYKDTDPGILINIYQALASYTMPGPTVWAGKRKRDARSYRA